MMTCTDFLGVTEHEYCRQVPLVLQNVTIADSFRLTEHYYCKQIPPELQNMMITANRFIQRYGTRLLQTESSV